MNDSHSAWQWIPTTILGLALSGCNVVADPSPVSHQDGLRSGVFVEETTPAISAVNGGGTNLSGPDFPPGHPYAHFNEMIIARAQVVEILPDRTSTISGTIPTRDPGIPVGQDLGSPETKLWRPIRFELLEIYKSDVPNVTGIVIAEPSGYAADNWLLSAVASSFELPELSVGSEGIVFFAERSDVTSIRSFLVGWATEESRDGEIVIAGRANRWYGFNGTTAQSLDSPAFEIPDLIMAIQTEVAEPFDSHSE